MFTAKQNQINKLNKLCSISLPYMFSEVILFQERVQVDLLEGGSVGETAVISCADGERSMSGYTLPIDFVLKSSSRKYLKL